MTPRQVLWFVAGVLAICFLAAALVVGRELGGSATVRDDFFVLPETGFRVEILSLPSASGVG